MIAPIFFTNLKKIIDTNLADKKTVLVGGCFDVLHYGHVHFLEYAKKHTNAVIVALESDEFIQQYKKRKPVHTQLERKKILEALRTVDAVIALPLLSGYEDYMQLVTAIHPYAVALTEGDPQLANKQKQAQHIGARVIVCPFIQGFSTSRILAR